ncbi:hypothetical protein L1987_30399 [Smallanthus sonchifolius]|uniref:Uncharacterized protein n=1 Tax=Smallanthus sonchifolius TaxID=185202 RepID=A0ACB9I232_9ASTR|nr:hypothetical protein L1987_30399 [Smallanthus sonchifolius]
MGLQTQLGFNPFSTSDLIASVSPLRVSYFETSASSPSSLPSTVPCLDRSSSTPFPYALSRHVRTLPPPIFYNDLGFLRSAFCSI